MLRGSADALLEEPPAGPDPDLDWAFVGIDTKEWDVDAWDHVYSRPWNNKETSGKTEARGA